jgi:hypothetical protein
MMVADGIGHIQLLVSPSQGTKWMYQYQYKKNSHKFDANIKAHPLVLAHQILPHISMPVAPFFPSPDTGSDKLRKVGPHPVKVGHFNACKIN